MTAAETTTATPSPVRRSRRQKHLPPELKFDPDNDKIHKLSKSFNAKQREPDASDDPQDKPTDENTTSNDGVNDKKSKKMTSDSPKENVANEDKQDSEDKKGDAKDGADDKASPEVVEKEVPKGDVKDENNVIVNGETEKEGACAQDHKDHQQEYQCKDEEKEKVETNGDHKHNDHSHEHEHGHEHGHEHEHEHDHNKEVKNEEGHDHKHEHEKEEKKEAGHDHKHETKSETNHEHKEGKSHDHSHSHEHGEDCDICEKEEVPLTRPEDLKNEPVPEWKKKALTEKLDPKLAPFGGSWGTEATANAAVSKNSDSKDGDNKVEEKSLKREIANDDNIGEPAAKKVCTEEKK